MGAAQGGNLDFVKLLLNKETDVNAKKDDGEFLILFFIVQRQFVSYFHKASINVYPTIGDNLFPTFDKDIITNFRQIYVFYTFKIVYF